MAHNPLGLEDIGVAGAPIAMRCGTNYYQVTSIVVR